jgi:hypothetical protein
VSDPQVANPGVVAWRTRQLVGIVLAAGLVLAVLTLIASQADPNAVDLAATRWLQRFDSPMFFAFMAAASWFGFAPQSLVMPVALASLFAARRLWVEALLVLGSQGASLVTIGLKDIVHRARPSPDLVGVFCATQRPELPEWPRRAVHHALRRRILPRLRARRTVRSANRRARASGPADRADRPLASLSGSALAERSARRLRRGSHAASSLLLGVCEVAFGCHTSSIDAPTQRRPRIVGPHGAEKEPPSMSKDAHVREAMRQAKLATRLASRASEVEHREDAAARQMVESQAAAQILDLIAPADQPQSSTPRKLRRALLIINSKSGPKHDSLQHAGELVERLAEHGLAAEAGHHQVAPEDEAANVAAGNGAHDAQDASSV